MKDKDLLKRLRKLGFPLFETKEAEDANLTLADVVQSKDLRFWEGFPVVLATSAEKGLFDYSKTVALLKKVLDKLLLSSLVAMSLALYKNLNMKFSWSDSLYDLLGPEKKKEYEAFLTALKKDEELNVGGRMMSSERLKSVVTIYFRKQTEGLHDLLSAKDEMGLEYAMSQVFSPKQKELFLKKLKGEVFTKTEKEYFSRAVKKKVLALANPDLHRLSRKLLEL
ncbi:MAG: hypothetical protein PHV48_07955 [Candidatus Omnitrophica bacterium]|nr:hypothetical protein [Candidatus Omnitrophota bacterium]